jgi:hypothetical protein
MRTYTSFEQFWPHYLREHADRGTRTLHYIGTGLTRVVAAAAIVTGKWWMLLLIPVVGYGFAWASHAFVERNKPATFTYPLWSLMSDYRMFFLALTGRLRPELERAGVSVPGENAPPRPSATP